MTLCVKRFFAPLRMTGGEKQQNDAKKNDQNDEAEKSAQKMALRKKILKSHKENTAPFYK